MIHILPAKGGVVGWFHLYHHPPSMCYVLICCLSYVSIFCLCYVSSFSLCYVSIFSLCYVRFLVCVMCLFLVCVLCLFLAWRASLRSAGARFARGGVPGWAEVHRHQPPQGGWYRWYQPPLSGKYEN